MAEPVTIELEAPVKAFGEERDSITMRPPTLREIRECGFPFRVYEDESVMPVASVIARYISKLADIPPGTVDKMTPRDFRAAMGAVLGFFKSSDRPESEAS